MKYLIVIALMIGSMGANAYTIMGIGNSSCGQYTERVRTGNIDYKYMYMSWVHGWLTARGYFESDSTGGPIRDLDTDAYMAFVLKFCTDNPLSSISDATQALAIELEIK